MLPVGVPFSPHTVTYARTALIDKRIKKQLMHTDAGAATQISLVTVRNEASKSCNAQQTQMKLKSKHRKKLREKCPSSKVTPNSSCCCALCYNHCCVPMQESKGNVLPIRFRCHADPVWSWYDLRGVDALIKQTFIFHRVGVLK